ncbi:Carboxylesterase patB [Lachnellula suecica]|uniref:Carboxylic ester hydrolase n=1 Tax=Lachnellula suecica TaxID=602035 RepID=A0A8T9C4Y0_9HELO|nr:Carboxylesterase patB [Lachnellula suecica]
MNFRVASLAFAAQSILSNVAASSLPTVDLGYSVHQATLNNKSSGPDSYFNFSNIRFGQAPVGPLRFSAPLAPEGRNETVNDGQQSVICPQANPEWIINQESFILAYLLGSNTSKYTNSTTSTTATSSTSLPTPAPGTSEDCLFLDVIVPEKIFNSGNAKRKRQEGPYAVQCQPGSPCTEVSVPQNGTETSGAPVLVWIFGGGYVEGSKVSYGNPAGLVARSLEDDNEGLIYVAMNYRLGLFGWLSAVENVTANVGLLDQRLALDWVQKNIHLFGGDPSRVTVMGESAGAGSIMHHITAHGGNGSIPFQQAIPQSPAFQPLVPVESQTIFEEVMGNASLLANTSITSAEQLRELPFDVLFAANTLITARSQYGQFTFGPAIDPSNNSYVPDLPIKLLARGEYHNVSILVGHNSDEGLLFTPPYIQTQGDFEQLAMVTFPTANSTLVDTIVDVLYPPVFNGSYGYSDQIGRTAIIIADFIVGCNAHSLAATLTFAYAYLFDVPPGLHGEDSDYTFFNGDTSTSDDGLPVNATVAEAFQRYLVNFAMTGLPTSKGYDDFVRYGSNDSVSNIGLTASKFGTHIKDPAARSQCTFWQEAPYDVET